MQLADYMKAKRLSDEQFAEIIGKSRPTVSRIRRQVVRPDWRTIQAIQAATKGKVTANDFINIKGAE